MDAFPRTIWFHWMQGLSAAPRIVRSCHESWAAANPNWDVVVIDETNLRDYVQADFANGQLKELPLNQKADLIRLDLLARHGGVWTDASCYCVRPLDGWLPAVMRSGFFAFQRPGRDRLLSSWFLSAVPSHVLTTKWYEMMLSYWGEHTFRSHERPLLHRAVDITLQRSIRLTRLWFSPFVRDRLAVAPYFAIHYAFAELVGSDSVCREAWQSVPPVSSDVARGLLRDDRPVQLTPTLKQQIDTATAPLYKLSRRVDQVPVGSALAYLLAVQTA